MKSPIVETTTVRSHIQISSAPSISPANARSRRNQLPASRARACVRTGRLIAWEEPYGPCAWRAPPTAVTGGARVWRWQSWMDGCVGSAGTLGIA